MEKHLVIRVDASTQMGTGHLMRCLALAQAWKDASGKVAFITACQTEGLLERLQEEGFDINLLAHSYPDPGDWHYTKDILAAHPNTWVVLDGYHFNEGYQQWAKEAGHRLLVIDDMAHLKHYYADILLNQNLNSQQLDYSCEPYTRLLLGTHYVLLRREFLSWRDWKREIPTVARHILVTLGGSDPENHTLKVIEALQKVNATGLEAVVVVGASNPHADVLEAATRQSRIPVRLVRNARNVPELMAWADIAVSSSGTTVWELLSLATPILAVVLAPNQRHIAEQIDKRGAGETLGQARNITTESLAKAITLLLEDSELRATMSGKARQMVDGEGISRVIMHLTGEKLRLRHVQEEDCRVLWEWINDLEVRASAFSSHPISWEEHIRWITQRLNDPHCVHFIALDDQDMPVGQVRFDVHDEEAEIDISVDRQRRGRKYGSCLIEIAVEKMFLTSPVKVVHAYVKPQNKASIHAFRKAGFQDLGLGVMRRHQAVHLIRTNNDA